MRTSLPLLLMLAACDRSIDGDDKDASASDTEATVACPNLVVSPEELVWTRTQIGESDVRELTVLNDCNDRGNAEGTATVLDSDVFSMEEASFSLVPGGSAVLSVAFTPIDDGNDYWFGTLQVVGAQGTKAVSLYGTLVPTDTELTDTETDTDDPTDDGDGDGYTTDDCDDSDADVHPGASESWNTVDDDCDGFVDEDFISEGTVFFTEVMADPAAVSDKRGQYLELYNAASKDVDLVGWTLVDNLGNTVTIDESFVIGAREYAVLGGEGSKSLNGGVDVDLVYDSSTLNLAYAGKVKLFLDTENIATVRWRDWDMSEGVAMGLDPDELYYGASQDDDQWCAASSELSGGDYGTPGEANDACAAVGTIDADGDGWSEADGDCDDSEATANPDGTEVAFNDIDEDCDGLYNEQSLRGGIGGYLDGASGDYLGYNFSLSTGDVDRDFKTDVLLGGHYLSGYKGRIYGVKAAKYATFAGYASAYDRYTVASTSTSNFLASLGPQQGGPLSKNKDDLVVAGTDAGTAYPGSVAVAVFTGDTTVSGSLDQSDADVTLVDSYSSTYNRVLSHVDLDGDGYEEVIYGEPKVYFGSGDTDNYTGRVTATDIAGQSGELSLDDADVLLLGDAQFDYLGSQLGGADLDGDGYDDLVLGAPGDDTEGTEAGSVYLFMGDSTLSEDDDIGNVAQAHLSGSKGDEVGSGQLCLADVYDDGTLDLVVGGPEGDIVYLVDDIGTQSGDVTLTATADDIIDGSGSVTAFFGLGLACGDFTGDGHADVAIGAPDEDTYLNTSSDEGRVYLFPGADLTGGTWDEDDAALLLLGKKTGDATGQALLSVDFDGDGVDDLVVASPTHNSDYGRVWFVHDLGSL